MIKTVGNVERAAANQTKDRVASKHPSVNWPSKAGIFGVQISVTYCDEACDAILTAARVGEPAVVSAFSVHALIEATSVPVLREKVNRFEMIVPDGQPVRWALNWLHGARLRRNVRGLDLMWQLCQRAAVSRVPVYFYGGTRETVAALAANLHKAFPSLEIAGAESPPFRPLAPEERLEMIDRVNSSGAGLMFIGLGCPKQDYFAAEHVSDIGVVQVCVGAAFDFHAGTKRIAPPWMQSHGLEWLFRLCQEPRRLWKRYLITNSQFLWKLFLALVCKRLRVPGDLQCDTLEPTLQEQASP